MGAKFKLDWRPRVLRQPERVWVHRPVLGVLLDFYVNYIDIYAGLFDHLGAQVGRAVGCSERLFPADTEALGRAISA